jgi:hypothetical protein
MSRIRLLSGMERQPWGIIRGSRVHKTGFRRRTTMSSSDDDNSANNNNAPITPPATTAGAYGVTGETVRGTDELSSSQVATQQQSDFIEGDTTEPNIMVQRILRYLQIFSTIISESPVWRKYSTNLSVKPVLTKSFSSMIGFCIGDMIAQIISRKVART